MSRWTGQPIETVYGMYRFRSRLEARWAVFFTELGVPYEYEPEGFVLAPGVLYLPDFWLPVQQTWVEVKPDLPSAEDSEKAALLCIQTQRRVYEAWGGLPTLTEYDTVAYTSDSGYITTPPAESGHLGGDNCYKWCVCLMCGLAGLEFDGRSERLPCGCSTDEEASCTEDHPRIIRALRAAHQARFEHDERRTFGSK